MPTDYKDTTPLIKTSEAIEPSQTGADLSDGGIRTMQGSDELLEREEREEEIKSESEAESDWNQIEPDTVTNTLGKNTVWDQGSVPRGRDYEALRDANIAGNFPVIDDFDTETGTATSYKTIDLNSDSYQDSNTLTETVIRYVDKLDDFNGCSWGGHSVPGEAINKKVLCIGVPTESATKDQKATLQQSTEYAQEKGIKLVMEEVP